MDKKQLKKECFNLYKNGKNLSEIAQIMKFSRKYITDLLNENEDFLKLKLSKKIKVYKRKTNNQMIIPIPTEFIKKIGISDDKNKPEYVNVTYNEDNKMIVIKRA